MWIGGIPSQVIENETGLLVELNKIEELKNNILELASNKELREKMGNSGRKRIFLG